jgi:predicted RNA polymerase sigma factor
VRLYGALNEIAPSPIVELNAAVALAMARGPAAGLARVDALAGEPALRRYHLLPSVRGDLLAKLGRPTRRARNSSARPSSRTMRASARCCSNGPPHAPRPVEESR